MNFEKIVVFIGFFMFGISFLFRDSFNYYGVPFLENQMRLVGCCSLIISFSLLITELKNRKNRNKKNRKQK